MLSDTGNPKKLHQVKYNQKHTIIPGTFVLRQTSVYKFIFHELLQTNQTDK